MLELTEISGNSVVVYLKYLFNPFQIIVVLFPHSYISLFVFVKLFCKTQFVTEPMQKL